MAHGRQRVREELVEGVRHPEVSVAEIEVFFAIKSILCTRFGSRPVKARRIARMRQLTLRPLRLGQNFPHVAAFCLTGGNRRAKLLTYGICGRLQPVTAKVPISQRARIGLLQSTFYKSAFFELLR